MNPLMIGIDVGTTKIKICILNDKGKILKQVSDDVLVRTPKLGYVEMDLENLMKKIRNLTKLVSSGYEQYVESIGFSVTSPTLVLMDKELNPIRPGITYMDNRSLENVSHFVDKLGGKDYYFSKVGNKPSPSTCTVGLIDWLKENEPSNWEITYKVGYLNTFLAAQFTDNVVTEPTTASYSGIMDIKKPINWDAELVKVSGIEQRVLPDIVPSFSKVGTLNKKTADMINLKRGIAVTVGCADTAAASLALGLKKNGDIFQSMGTSEVLTICLNKPDLSEAFMNRSHVIPGLWLCNGAMSTTGAAITWLKNNVFLEFGDLEELEEEALKSIPGSNGLIFLPYLSGERSPIFDSEARGMFFGLSLNTGRADIVRAVYEGAGYGIKQIYNIANKKWNIKPEFIKCVGGATKSLLAMQVRADLLNKELRSIESDYTSAYGAALLGGMAAGNYDKFDDLPFLDSISTKVCPISENVEKYSKYIEIYDNLYPALKKSMHMLSGL